MQIIFILIIIVVLAGLVAHFLLRSKKRKPKTQEIPDLSSAEYHDNVNYKLNRGQNAAADYIERREKTLELYKQVQIRAEQEANKSTRQSDE